MRILLIDEGEGFPNLALMKLSGYFKEQGHEVKFGACKNPDRVYISCVFPANRENSLSASKYYPKAEIYFGGGGFNLNSKLPDEIEHHKPDYSIYPHVDFSLGFTTRGCIRNCGFCIVPEKEGPIRAHSPLKEFVEPSFNKIMLLDNNLLSYSKHEDTLQELIEIDKKVSFSQGLDIRLINKRNAGLLKQIKYYDSSFKDRRLYFAWDFPEIEKHVKKGIPLLLNEGILPRHLMFYVLMCYNTTYEQDKYRLQTLIDFGVLPYVMLYNGLKGTYQHHMKRWIEWRYYKMVPWLEYDHGDSQFQIKEAEV